MGAGLPFRLLIILIVMVIAIAAQSPCLPAPDRTTISLNGNWQIETSKDARAIAVVWNQKASLPGLTHSADRAFPHVHEFDSRMLRRKRLSQGQGSLAKITTVNNAGLWLQGRKRFCTGARFLAELKSAAILRTTAAAGSRSLPAPVGEHRLGSGTVA